MRIVAPPPAPFDAPPGSPLILRDGSVATVRAAGPEDRSEIRRFFTKVEGDPDSCEQRNPRVLVEQERRT